MMRIIKSIIHGSIFTAVLFIGFVLLENQINAQYRFMDDSSHFIIKSKPNALFLPDSILTKINRISASTVFSDLAVIASDSMEGRGIGTMGYKRASDWVERQFMNTGFQPASNRSYKQFFFVSRKQIETRTHLPDNSPDTLLTWNLIGILPGADSLLKNEYIVLTAHLDHIGRTKDSVYYGANDNASGVAVMLNAAKFIAQNPVKRTLIVIAFSGEESGLLGSRYFMENPVVNPDQIILLINLDIVGSGIDGMMLQGGERYTYQQSWIEKINIGNFQFNLATRPNSPNSDHYYFNVSGVPAMFIYTFNGSCPYHSPGDHPNCIDQAVLKNVTQFVTALFWFFGMQY